MKKILTHTLLLIFSSGALAQFDISVSQYMHNRYAINKAFAGNRETLTLFGSYRLQKWTDINGSPTGQYFSTHAPLKNKKMALGVELFNQEYAVSKHTGGTFSYTYRVKTGERTHLGFAINGGVNYMRAGWSGVSTFDEDDPAFDSDETIPNPVFGFGVSMYSDQFFAGLSTPSFIAQNEYAGKDSVLFDLAKATYIATAGYIIRPNKMWMLQPSFLARYDGYTEDVLVDVNATIVFNDLIWLGASYRTCQDIDTTQDFDATQDIVSLLGFQITPQLRFAYSYDIAVGDIRSYTNGSHEVSIQFDFGYKINSPNPRFF